MKARKRARKKHRGRSGYEDKIMTFLETQGVKYQYESETVSYTVPETKKRYIPDFKVGKVLIEGKGRWLAADRRKIKMVLQQNPGLNLKMLFMRDDPIRKGSKTRYSDVCKKLGIDYEISPTGSVPRRWITG